MAEQKAPGYLEPCQVVRPLAKSKALPAGREAVQDKHSYNHCPGAVLKSSFDFVRKFSNYLRELSMSASLQLPGQHLAPSRTLINAYGSAACTKHRLTTPGCLRAFLHLYSPYCVWGRGWRGGCTRGTATVDLGDPGHRTSLGKSGLGSVPARVIPSTATLAHSAPTPHLPPAPPQRGGGPRRPQATPPDAHWTASRGAPPPAAAGQ